MNCRVTYTLTVAVREESRGSIIILGVGSTAEATSRAMAQIQPILDRTPAGNGKGLAMRVTTLPHQMPARTWAAVNAMRCHVWPVLALTSAVTGWVLWITLAAAVIAGLVMLYAGCQLAAEWLRDRGGMMGRMVERIVDGPGDEELPPQPEAGAMTAEERESLLRAALICALVHKSAVSAEALRKGWGISQAQIVAFLVWVCARTVEHEGVYYRCSVCVLLEQPWLQFHRQESVTAVNGRASGTVVVKGGQPS